MKLTAAGFVALTVSVGINSLLPLAGVSAPTTLAVAARLLGLAGDGDGATATFSIVNGLDALSTFTPTFWFRALANGPVSLSLLPGPDRPDDIDVALPLLATLLSNDKPSMPGMDNGEAGDGPFSWTSQAS